MYYNEDGVFFVEKKNILKKLLAFTRVSSSVKINFIVSLKNIFKELWCIVIFYFQNIVELDKSFKWCMHSIFKFFYVFWRTILVWSLVVKWIQIILGLNLIIDHVYGDILMEFGDCDFSSSQ